MRNVLASYINECEFRSEIQITYKAATIEQLARIPSGED